MTYVIILLVLHILGIGIVVAKHGEPKDGKYNVFITLTAEALELWLLYKAGLFSGLLAIIK